MTWLGLNNLFVRWRSARAGDNLLCVLRRIDGTVGVDGPLLGKRVTMVVGLTCLLGGLDLGWKYCI